MESVLTDQEVKQENTSLTVEDCIDIAEDFANVNSEFGLSRARTYALLAIAKALNKNNELD